MVEFLVIVATFFIGYAVGSSKSTEEPSHNWRHFEAYRTGKMTRDRAKEMPWHLPEFDFYFKK